MIFSWSERKNGINQKKHGISFEIAQTVFSDPYHLEDCLVDEEQRYQVVGLTDGALLLVVVIVYRDTNLGGEVIHIISARKAEYYEQSAYEEQFG
jgi:uncharacterized DUF497 family protein